MRWQRWLRPAIVVVAVLVAASAIALLVAGDDDDQDGTTVASRATTTSTEPGTSTSLATTTTTTTAVTTTTTAAGPTAAPAAPTTTRPATPTTRPSSPSCPQPASGSDFAGFGATTIVIENASGSHRSCVLTADTAGQRQQGLMHQDDLDGYEGMIFRFPDEQQRAFWMRNTRIPLSIAFFAANGAFVSSADMEPCGDRSDCPTYPSDGPAKFALEVLQGRLPAVGATAGSRLTSSG